jgi:pimeloyl-ACP methyl ester carboxylesterase
MGAGSPTSQWGARMLAPLLLTFAAVALLAGPAAAEYQGTPGKVVYVDGSGGTASKFPLKLWDPGVATPTEPSKGIRTLVEETFHYPTGPDELVLGQASTPVFSPDGTKIAYSKIEPDEGWPDEVTGYHTAIWVANADGSEPKQITFPAEAVVPPPECNPCNGHSVADYMPTWSPDGNTIAFVRSVQAGEIDSMYPQRGINIWTVSAKGGGETQLTTGEERIYMADVWGKRGIVVAYDEPNEEAQVLGLLSSGGGEPSMIADPKVVTDFDVSPDGEHVTYSTRDGGAFDDHVVNVDGGDDEILAEGLQTVLTRYSNTGNGVLHDDCDQVEVGGKTAKRCGIFEEHTPDPEGDIRSDEPRDRFELGWIDSGGVDYSGGGYTRSLWDVQAQQLPVLFVPGFLGSEIKACGAKAWFNYGHLNEMSLASDGQTNAVCADAAPTGELISPFAYSGIAKWVKETFGASNTLFNCERAGVLGWDWRKAPQPNFEALNTKITEALQKDKCATEEGAKRVVIMAHSYGGLLTRAFIEKPEYAKRVARVLTVGTPYWGSPKAIFPSAYGIELPGSFLNHFFIQEELKDFSHNLTGLMQLFPSPNFGPWLSVDGAAALGGRAVSSFLGSLGNNTTLFEAAQTNHESIYDHFFTDYGWIDYRVVVGTGVLTPGSVSIEGSPGGESTVRLGVTNGDETVPAKSATMGQIGSQPSNPGVHIQDIGHITHMKEAESQPVEKDYLDYLDFGRTPRKTEGPASASGSLTRIYSGTLGEPKPQARQHVAVARGSRATGNVRAATQASEPVSLEEAAEAGRIDLFELPGETQFLANSFEPVTIAGTASGLKLTVTEMTDETALVTLAYGPLDGQVQITAGEEGTEVLQNGTPVIGTIVGGEEPPSKTGGGGTGGGGGSGGEGPSPGGAHAPGAVAPSALFEVARVKSNSHGDIALRLLAPGAGVFRARATTAVSRRAAGTRAARAHTFLYGTATGKAGGAGAVRLVIRPGKAARRALAGSARLEVTVSITFTASGGPIHSTNIKVPIARPRRH